MARLPEHRELNLDMIPDMPDWFEPAHLIINDDLGTLYDALNGNIGIENMKSAYRDINFTTDSTYIASQTFPLIRFKSPLKGKAHKLIIVQILYADTPTVAITSNVGVPNWDNVDNNNILIRFIPGLEDSTSYKLRIEISE